MTPSGFGGAINDAWKGLQVSKRQELQCHMSDHLTNVSIKIKHFKSSTETQVCVIIKLTRKVNLNVVHRGTYHQNF